MDHTPIQADFPSQCDSNIEMRVLHKILAHQAEMLGDKPFIDICGRKASFRDIHRISNQLANGLRALGVERSDRVALSLPNCLEFIAVWFAVAKLGAIEAPNNPELKGELLSHNLNNCGAKVLVIDAKRLSYIAQIQDELPAIETLILINANAEAARTAGVTIKHIVTFDECLDQPEQFEPVDIHYSDPMSILYTSGTTGPAKGVLMSHHHCYCWTMAMALNLGYTAVDSYFCALPLFHTDAQMFGVYLPLIFGTQTTLVESFSASRFWDQVRSSGATATNLLGAMGVILARAEPNADDGSNPLRVCQCIPMVPDKTAFEQRFAIKLVTGYGQTETSFVTLDTPDTTREGSCGKPHPDWEVAIVDEHDRPVGPGVVGEIVSRPKQNWYMFSGYYRAEARTLQTLRNLWYHSGDAGYRDEDGWFYFKHRLNEAIRRRGENISAFEVETVAEAHSDIVESAAYGVPSEFTEEDIMLVAMRRPGSALTPAELVEHFRAQAPRHMTPRYIELTDGPLPRTPTEKIARSELKKRGVTAEAFDRGTR
ncbi:AMP-binding protein [Brucella pecoris]|uniref:ATP-dependent acyl-CoA ligase n=1 Tax=Brucella pecoris TaxID=867683 RepID=A0A5C5CCC7_9HYPH|nr:AMP-binding protein [Brucella pecoris]MBB4096045.1 crotonobetaine/carnitine-CoA ligase [Brucella pecoris]TNV08932.1 ATP-dependent acyl-CoA ligase [Brucella pecoris]